MNNYSPYFYFQNPSQLAELLSSLNQLCEILSCNYKPKFEHVIFSIFHDADVDTMHWTCYCRGREMHTHDDLVNAWADAVPTLPDQVKTIQLDITPAPGWMREDRPNWVRGFIQDRRISKTFVPEHDDVTLLLIQRVHQHFGDGVTLQLSGQMSEKSRSSLDNLIARSVADGMDISFVGDVLAVQPTEPKPQLWKALRKLAPIRYGSRWPLPARNEQERQFARLRTVRWSLDTQKLWTRIGSQDEAWAIDLLITFGRFATNDELKNMDFLPMGSRQRALLHNMAKDLRYTTESVGEEPERFVRIEKCHGARPKTVALV